MVSNSSIYAESRWRGRNNPNIGFISQRTMTTVLRVCKMIIPTLAGNTSNMLNNFPSSMVLNTRNVMYSTLRFDCYRFLTEQHVPSQRGNTYQLFFHTKQLLRNQFIHSNIDIGTNNIVPNPIPGCRRLG